ncbi:MAG: hypothetical protein M0Z37_06075 [Nitrospiraceae bacterium]|nr:hypothetical protein [Nitrospiraceae bacterium]
MLKSRFYLLFVFLGLSLYPSGNAFSDPLSDSSPNPPIEYKGHLTGGIDAGITIPSQAIVSGAESIEGPTAQGNIFYGLTNSFLIGMNAGWYQTGYATGGVFQGNLQDFYLIPSVELRGQQSGAWSPFASLGMGANFNMFNSSQPGTSISPTDTLAFLASVGEDYFVTSHVAMDLELSWLMNTGMWTETTPKRTTGSTFNNSAVFLMAGIHFQ